MDETEFVIFRSDEFNRWWNQPAVGGTDHRIKAPQAVSLDEFLATVNVIKEHA